MEYKFKTETDYKISLQKSQEQEDIIKIKISIDFEKQITPKPVVIRWTHPCKNVFSQWYPQLWSARTLNPNWMPIKNASRSAEGTPLQTHLSLDGINEITVSVSDPLTPMEIAAGIIEETAEIAYKLTLFTKLVSPMDKYETVLTIDTRKLPYEEVLADTSRLWYGETSVPEVAKEPMYSTWYSYHQNLNHAELIAELKAAKQLGMETVIVDDGWQTCDGGRGYAHCGDWEPERLSDMKGFVSDVHDEGMKCMLWFGV
ncbi:MAG: alpha-galactosidase, partial [Clostridiales bacterium]|nr:alpha-galactosidase [Clostridiales bacterium]